MHNNENRPGYKKTTLGWIPEEWETNQIGKVCRSIVPGRNKPKTFSGSIPWITTPEITERRIPTKQQAHFVNEQEIKDSGAKIVPHGSVVFVCVGDLGITAITKDEVVLNQQLHAFVCPEYIQNEYLAYWLDTQKPYMFRVASTTTIPYLNKANCESIPLVYPPLPEQKAIAGVLSVWDRAIEKTERLIQAKEKRFAALVSDLICSPEFGRRHIREFTTEISVRNKGQQIGRVLSVTNHSGFVLPEDQFERSVASNDLSNYKVVTSGQYAYNPSRINVGSIARLAQVS